MTKFPPRNLPGSAGNWGRVVENFIKALDKRLSKLERSLSNSLRATGGQITGMAKQIQELALGRKSHYATAGAVSYPHVATSGQKLGPTVPLVFPGPRTGNRSAIMAFSYSVSTNNTIIGTSVWVELLLNGSPVWRSASGINLSGGSVPDNWRGGIVSSFAAVRVPTGDAEFSLRFWLYDMQSGTHTITFDNMAGTLTYGDMI